MTLVICMTSCVTTNPSTRIKIVEGRSYNQFTIIEVDGVEYLSSPNGGILPLVKDTSLVK